MRAPRFLLLYPPLQFGENEMAKPDGSLGLPYLAGALRRAGYEVAILDLSVGAAGDDVKETFFRATPLPSGLFRIGLSPERILEEVAPYEAVGITSIFTAQTTMVLETVRLIRRAFPDKLILAGGVNARSLSARFFAAGVDAITLAEGEAAVVEIARLLERGGRDLGEVPGLLLRVDGREVATAPSPVPLDLDELPLPAWDLLPLDKYWAISRPHGGDFAPGSGIRYAALMTSRGCPFSCAFCHVSKEREAPGGGAARLRFKSHERVMQELEILEGLGAEQIFLQDDSLLAHKPRITRIFRELRGRGLVLADVNGVNIVHLFRRRGGELVVDRELLETLVEVGFQGLSLAFESANQRILDTYAGGKWSVERHDTVALVRACVEAGLSVDASYMIGFPDETRAEIENTLRLARTHVDAGLVGAILCSVIPYPGSGLHDLCIREGLLSPDFDPDRMCWTHPIIGCRDVGREELDRLRQDAWLAVNRPEYVERKRAMTVARLGASR